jgi:RNA polymerase sigma factor (sigma-70 family)
MMVEPTPELIRRCQMGDSAAWRAFVERHTRLVWSVIRQHRLDDADAEDAHQAVFVAAVTNLGALRECDRVAAWLATTTRRECWRISRQRRRAPQEAVFGEVAHSGPRVADAAEMTEQRQIVRECLAELGGRCRQLLEALFSAPGEPSYPRIAEQVGMPVGSIGPTRARCLRRLCEILAGRGICGLEARSTSMEPRELGKPAARNED